MIRVQNLGKSFDARLAVKGLSFQASDGTFYLSVGCERILASILSAERVVFNIKGNDYRLITAINGHYQVLLIIWIGTHKEYDQIDARKVEYDTQHDTDPSN